MVRPNLYFTIEKNIIEPRINPGLDFLFILYQDKRKGKTSRVYFLRFYAP
jgi:hypothetical protein